MTDEPFWRLTAGDWHQIAGKGWAASFPGIPGLDPRSLHGQQVEIDGETYAVLGVETYAISNVTGKPFGLLVGER